MKEIGIIYKLRRLWSLSTITGRILGNRSITLWNENWFWMLGKQYESLYTLWHSSEVGKITPLCRRVLLAHL